VGGSPAEAKNNLGFAYQSAGNLPRAFDLYVEALRLDPGLTRARQNLREVAKQLERPVPPELASEPRS
jgi:tetratricopeptide (TPR) repeat protein